MKIKLFLGQKPDGVRQRNKWQNEKKMIFNILFIIKSTVFIYTEMVIDTGLIVNIPMYTKRFD